MLHLITCHGRIMPRLAELLLYPPHDIGGDYGFKLDVHVSVLPSFIGPSVRPSGFRFRKITSKHQWIFTKLGMYIDIVKIWFGIANWQISSNIYGVICPRQSMAGYYGLTFLFGDVKQVFMKPANRGKILCYA